MIEKVVAYVEDEAITLTELNEAYNKMKLTTPNISIEDVANILINRLLLLKEAKKMKLDSLSVGKDPVEEYIDIKIKSLIFIRDEDIQSFFDKNKEHFKDSSISNVKDKIELYLIEEETNKRIKEHLQMLKKNTHWGYLQGNLNKREFQ